MSVEYSKRIVLKTIFLLSKRGQLRDTSIELICIPINFGEHVSLLLMRNIFTLVCILNQSRPVGTTH